MRNFKVGDWVYASDWCYGQIFKINDDIAVVEYETDHGGGNCSFLLSSLKKAEPPKKKSLIVKPEYAVVITFSFDPHVSVLLFETWDEAMDFIKCEVEDEWEADIQESGWEAEYVVFEDEGRAVLTTHYDDGDGITEWRIGEVYDREEEE